MGIYLLCTQNYCKMIQYHELYSLDEIMYSFLQKNMFNIIYVYRSYIIFHLQQKTRI